jgi:hypothetical protein
MSPQLFYPSDIDLGSIVSIVVNDVVEEKAEDDSHQHKGDLYWLDDEIEDNDKKK